jgi:hypothetical protein
MRVQNLEHLPLAMRPAVTALAECVDANFGAALESWSLFGGGITPQSNPEHGAIRSVLVLSKVDLDAVRRLAARGPHFGRLHLVAPLILTPQFLRTSLDSFPLELLEIQQQYLPILGLDSFRDWTFADGDVRLQCERELKSIALALQHGVLTNRGQTNKFPKIVQHVIERLARTLRGLLWLTGRKQRLSLLEVVTAVEQLAARRLPGLRRAVLQSEQLDWDTFCQIYAEVEALGALTDG